MLAAKLLTYLFRSLCIVCVYGSPVSVLGGGLGFCRRVDSINNEDGRENLSKSTRGPASASTPRA